MTNENLKNVFSTLDALLSKTDISNLTADSSSFSELKDGYYLCEVEKVALKESSNHDPMVAFQFTVSEDGVNAEIDSKKLVHLTPLKNSKGRKLFVNYVLKDETFVRRFVTDMLKFEGDTPGEPLLPKEAFITSETLESAIAALVGYRIYIQVSTTEKDDGSKSTWNNLVSWKRATALELPQ